MNAVILCGGLSTRLGDITKTIPKIILPVGPKTVFDWQMEKIQKLGVKEVVLAAGHLAEFLYEQVGTKWQDIEIIYAIEDKRLGTGGAIKHALEYILHPDEPTIILNGDILTTADFNDMMKYLRSESDGIILGSKVEDVASYGTLIYNNQYHLEAFKEKEGKHEVGFINGGIYIFNPRFKKYFPEQQVFSIEYDVFPNVKDLDVYESDRAWIDVGVPERLEWARENWETFER